MARVTPDEFVEKHARRLKAAATDMRRGVEKVSVSPPAEAAKKIDKMRAHLLEKIDDGTVKRRLEAVTLEDWKSKMLGKGIGRVSEGIDAAAPKVRDFATQLLPAVDAAVTKVRALPDLTLEDSINRMNTYVRDMAKFRKT